MTDETNDECYFSALAAAFVRGKMSVPASLSDEEVIALGRAEGLRLHKFKRQTELPRVKKVLGILQGLAPLSLLDIGSGRGTFLWPLLDAFPYLEDKYVDVVTALETLEHLEQPLAAATEAVRVARNFVIASVPSKEDDNPEHIQLFDRNSFKKLWLDAGAKSVKIEYVLNHIITVAKV